MGTAAPYDGGASAPTGIAVATGPAVATPEQAEAGSGMMMAPTEALQETLYSEMRGRIKEDDAIRFKYFALVAEEVEGIGKHKAIISMI